jgi:Eco57I restriction-modification methylase
VVYRLIFLFVAEDRSIDGQSLLHPPDNSEAARTARQRFADHYSTARLRELAGTIKGSRHGDLWRQFQLLIGALSGDEACAAARQHLALPVLGSLLWDQDATAALNDAELTNHDFLEALRHLAFTRQGKMLRPVDYKNLGAEELGGVYESLLALTPQISADGARFSFAEFAGNQRKTSGSYYTPDSLVQCLLDSALDPVVEERLEEAKRLASREVASRGRDMYASQLVSGFDRVAEGHRSGGAVLSGDQRVPEGRTLRHDFPDTPRVSLDSSQYRGGLGPGGEQGIHPVSSRGPGKSEGARNPSHPLPARGAVVGSAGSPPFGTLHRSWQDDAFPDWFFAAQAEVGPTSLPPYSLLAEKALLSLKVCDPAVGSGHFLVGAAHRLARHLARVRALAQGESEPSPLLYQHALRDVIGRCLYGVDVNPMAAELCRVSLWLEALEPGKPLSFLDHHIRVGNSLLGATPELIAAGLPDDAFKPIEGDDKPTCSALRRRNKQEREGRQRDMLHLMVAESVAEYNSLTERTRQINEAPDDTVDQVHGKAELFGKLVISPAYQHAQLIADAWCAAFVWHKHPNAPGEPLTMDSLCRLESDPNALAPAQRAEVERLSRQYQFFHWHLAFPEVFAKGGFDCVLGNPPWERVKLQEKEWFADRRPEIASATSAAERKRLIEELRTEDVVLYAQFADDLRKAEGESHLLRDCGLYPRCARGDLNFYAVFTERMLFSISSTGRVGCVIPSGIATDDSTREFFQHIVGGQQLVSLFEFENEGFFAGAGQGHMVRFALTTLSGVDRKSAMATFLFQGKDVTEIKDPTRQFTLASEDIVLLNPNTQTCPIFRTTQDAELCKHLYRRAPILVREGPPEENPWGIRFSRLFDMSNDSHLFRTREQLEASGWRLEGNVFGREGKRYLLLIESKMIYLFTHDSLIFRAVCENQDRASYRCLQESVGARGCVVVRGRRASDDSVGGALPG